ncbi:MULTISPECIES: phage baseplate assembly protein V [Pseudomonas chlororaphis group]|uniref:phage baseplate assembly protein V n=1 Tax=Pseudomonas chlororaphis group TaxID=136842 RepID=UPI0020983D78|nr:MULTISPECIES: phage baseplate assembly protein V [Pseudomonas chlororaphis group]MCO7576164.1 phage baseplate assembly protein V [Pseudomonas protegens]MCO7580998.1 phage baseplate assembly protein V [Pseudomonas chlororaphis]MCO7597977.1 phage baseplate assembly protein V [Pseudomonas chlororaphis]
MSDALRELGSRVRMMFGRGVLRSVTDTGPRQQVQVELLKDELRDGLEHMQNYGFTSHPTGGDCAVAFNGGNREQGIVLVIDDRRYRIPLEAGEVAMYDDQGNKIELLRDMVKITAVQHVEVTAPTIKLIGNLEVIGNLEMTGNINTTGTVTNNGKNIGSTHQHNGVLVGVANTGAPI